MHTRSREETVKGSFWFLPVREGQGLFPEAARI